MASEHFIPRIQFKLKQRKKKEPALNHTELETQNIGYVKCEPSQNIGYVKCEPSDFDMRKNRIFLKEKPDDPFLSLSLEEVLREAHYKEQGTMIVAEAFYDPCNEMLNAKTCRGNLSAAYIFGVQGAEVEVDTETGKVKILQFAAAHDVGRVINQQTIRGQIYGGIFQGVGYALCEEYKTEKGKNLNPNFLDYKILSAPDADFPIHLVPTAPAIANAIYDAVGVRIRDLPITPEKVMAAIQKKSGK